MEKLRKLPRSPGIANPLGKSRRDRPKGRDEDRFEKARKRRHRPEDEDEASGFPRATGDSTSRDPSPEDVDNGHLLDEKA